MLLTRYEILIDGEHQNIGFLQGLKDVTDDINSYESAIEDFNKKLIVPELKYFQTTGRFYTASFFTPKGLKDLKTEIDRLINYIKCCGADIITIIKDVDSNNDDIVYADELQVLMKTYYN